MEGEQLKLNRQFYDERWSKHRTVTSLDWSTQVRIIIKRSLRSFSMDGFGLPKSGKVRNLVKTESGTGYIGNVSKYLNLNFFYFSPY